MSFGRTRVGVVIYGDRADVQFNLNKYTTKEEVINAMRFVPNIGRTNTQVGKTAMFCQVQLIYKEILSINMCGSCYLQN